MRDHHRAPINNICGGAKNRAAQVRSNKRSERSSTTPLLPPNQQPHQHTKREKAVSTASFPLFLLPKVAWPFPLANFFSSSETPQFSKMAVFAPPHKHARPPPPAWAGRTLTRCRHTVLFPNPRGLCVIMCSPPPECGGVCPALVVSLPLLFAASVVVDQCSLGHRI